MEERECVRRSWNSAAEYWDDFIETGLDYARLNVHGPALIEACGPVKGLNVLDVGCGQGYFSRRLARLGAKVVGIDLAENMIDNARAHEQKNPLGIGYRVLDASEIGDVWRPATFDLVTACMSLHDMPDPGRVLHACSKMLVNHGVMAFSVVHPVNDAVHYKRQTEGNANKGAFTIDHYFAKGSVTVSWNMQRLKHQWKTIGYRFTISDWSRMIGEGGFLIEKIGEPRPTRSQCKEHPELEPCYEIPFFLVFRIVKKPRL